MVGPFVVVGAQHGPRPRWDVSEVGKKAVGLVGLPTAWCPPFLVVTTAAHHRWCSSTAGTDNARWLFEEIGLRSLIDSVFGIRPSTAKILIRSSAPEEGLEDRGRYESADCCNRDDEIVATIERLWAESGQTASGLALIMQPMIDCALKGHLSNERRLSKEARDWMCEYESGGRRPRTKRIAAGDAVANIGEPLACSDRSALFGQLACVAAAGTRVWGRVHYEWVWDGRNLWVVQQDIEEPKVGEPPGSAGLRSVQQPSLDLNVLIPSERAIGPWHKVSCARVFRECGLRTVPIYVIEGDAVIRGLAAGQDNPLVADEVGRLGASPIVVRTDVDKAARHPPTLLARTDSVDAPTALRFVAEQAASLMSAGLEPSQFCFLLHNYTSAKGSSLSRALPSSNLVKIDATWGNADGLMYYPHDSFEVNLGQRPTVRQRLRCKSRFIDCDSKGQWAEREGGMPWDWLPSLSRTDAVSIAQASKRIADHVGHPVEVMHFFGVDAGELSPVCLPWYFNSESKDEADPTELLQAAVSIFSNDIVTIRTEEDLHREAKRAAGRKPLRGCTLQLVPSPELMRNQSFLAGVSKFAVQYRLPVRLVGSALSHVFYVLRRHGVRMKVPHPFRRGPRPQRFNKLVRDNIPQIIRGHGETAQVARVRLTDHPDLIKAKLVEEAFELFWEQESKGLRRELADVLEVMRTICNLNGVDFTEIMAEAERRREDRGGFELGTILLKTGPHVSPPRATQPTLFDISNEGEEQQGNDDLVTRRPTPDQPRGTKTGLSIPLIPPDSSHPQWAYSVRSGDGKLDVFVTYTGHNILIRPAPTIFRAEENPQGKKAGEQGGLFDEESPEG